MASWPAGPAPITCVAILGWPCSGHPDCFIIRAAAAVGTSLAQLIIAAVSTWFGGWVDYHHQRITGN